MLNFKLLEGGRVGKVIKHTGMCDICRSATKEYIYDAKTQYGPWAWMCDRCYPTCGIKLGTGMGQKYKVVAK